MKKWGSSTLGVALFVVMMLASVFFVIPNINSTDRNDENISQNIGIQRTDAPASLFNQNGISKEIASELMQIADRANRSIVQVGGEFHTRSTSIDLSVANSGILPEFKLFETVQSNTEYITEFTEQSWRLVYITWEGDNPIFTFWMSGIYRQGIFSNSISNSSANGPNRDWNIATHMARNQIVNDFGIILDEYFDNALPHIRTPLSLPGRWQGHYEGTRSNVQTSQGFFAWNSMHGDTLRDKIWFPSGFEVGIGTEGLWTMTQSHRSFLQNNLAANTAWLRSVGNSNHGALNIVGVNGSVEQTTANSVRGFLPAIHIEISDADFEITSPLPDPETTMPETVIPNPSDPELLERIAELESMVEELLKQIAELNSNMTTTAAANTQVIAGLLAQIENLLNEVAQLRDMLDGFEPPELPPVIINPPPVELPPVIINPPAGDDSDVIKVLVIGFGALGVLVLIVIVVVVVLFRRKVSAGSSETKSSTGDKSLPFPK